MEPDWLWRRIQRRTVSLARRLRLAPRDDYRWTEDRLLLERVVFSYLNQQTDCRRILFVGCEWYTKHYEKAFAHREYWTIEPDPTKARFGGPRHIVAPLRALAVHAERDYFDVIVCNGVFMITAMETRDEAEPSFDACFETLRPGGLFVLGWNDTAALRPYPPADSAALARFEPFVMPPLGVAVHRTNTDYRHVYNFYLKPDSNA